MMSRQSKWVEVRRENGNKQINFKLYGSLSSVRREGVVRKWENCVISLMQKYYVEWVNARRIFRIHYKALIIVELLH